MIVHKSQLCSVEKVDLMTSSAAAETFFLKVCLCVQICQTHTPSGRHRPTLYKHALCLSPSTSC